MPPPSIEASRDPANDPAREAARRASDSDGHPPLTAAAVIVAAGASLRMGGPIGARKPFLDLDGRSVVELACAAFDRARHVTEIVLVAHADDVQRLQRMTAEFPALAKVRVVVAGGPERAESVRIGVSWTGFEVDVVAVHDAARPLVEPATIDAAIEAAAREGAAVVAVPVTDTIKSAADAGHVAATLDRERLWRAQTPQAFRAQLLRELVARAAVEGFRPTDEAALHERYVGPVAIVRGSEHNLKVTTPEDVVLARAILAARDGAPAR